MIKAEINVTERMANGECRAGNPNNRMDRSLLRPLNDEEAQRLAELLYLGWRQGRTIQLEGRGQGNGVKLVLPGRGNGTRLDVGRGGADI